jgi:chorismate mutase
MIISPLTTYIPNLKANKPLIISGPCSAESEEQMVMTAKEIADKTNTHLFRAGIWKPRTRPGHFEGIGTEGLKWLKTIKQETSLPVCTEVAKPQHVEAALKHNVDVLWIGARTVSNPFSVQEIADSLKGIDIPVFIKNPINPDLQLWHGAIERIAESGISKLAAIHRGFYPYEETKFRNIPKWEVAIELKRLYHDLPIICDPSHISGTRSYITEVSQKAMDLNFDGLMIETHIQPSEALSDANQQITPESLKILLSNLILREGQNDKYEQEIQTYREQIDSIDQQLLEMLSQRMSIIKKIGEYKSEQNITILQLRRWEKIMETRSALGKKLGLNKAFIKKLLELMHKESIQLQNDIMNKNK